MEPALLLSVTCAVFAGTASIYGALVLAAAIRERLRRGPVPSSRPPVSVLVPVCGAEPRLRENLTAILASLDANDQLLVGAALADDPALAIARSIDDRRLEIVAGSSSQATNRKIATLVALEPRISNELVVVVDSDVRLDRTLLAELVAPLADRSARGATAGQEIGIATGLYRGEPVGGGFAARLEALMINGDFVPSVLVADMLGGGIQFALGAANALRRDALAASGGFERLGEVLADDHHLGKRIAATGRGVAIAPAVVPIAVDSSPRDTIARLLRWCRTYRVCQPTGYAATIFSHHATSFAVGLALASASLPNAGIWRLAAGCAVAWRWLTAATAHVLIAGGGADVASFLLLPLRDLVQSVLFVLAWTGRTVTWRGRRFSVASDGTMVCVSGPSSGVGSEPQNHRAVLVTASGGS